MDNKASVAFFEELRKKAQENSAYRLKKVTNEFRDDLLGEKPYHKDYQEVMGWMFELYNVNSTTFYTLFKKVMSGATDLSTLEGLEEMRSFVGNFFDDSYVKLVIDQRIYDGPEFGNRAKGTPIDVDPHLDYHFAWANDTEECLSTKELVDVIRKVYTADYEWCKRFNTRFTKDKFSQNSKHDLSLMEKI